MRRNGNFVGIFLIGLGLLIVFSLMLPACAWWFLFGAALIAIGIKISKC